MRKADLGDWFLIFLLSKNLDSILFKEFISQLSEKLKTEPWDDLIWDTDPSQVLLQVNSTFFKTVISTYKPFVFKTVFVQSLICQNTVFLWNLLQLTLDEVPCFDNMKIMHKTVLKMNGLHMVYVVKNYVLTI